MINNTTTMRKKFDSNSNSKTDKVVVGDPVIKWIDFKNYIELTAFLDNSVGITVFLDDTKSTVVLLNGNITPQIISDVPKITTPNLREIEILTENVKCLVTGPLSSGGNIKIEVFSRNFITTLMHSKGSLTTTVVSGGVVSGGKVSGGEVSGCEVSGGSTSEVSDGSTLPPLPPLRQGDPKSLRLNAKSAAKRAAACASARAAARAAACAAACAADLEKWFINFEVNTDESNSILQDMINLFSHWCSCEDHPVLDNGGICRICAAKP